MCCLGTKGADTDAEQLALMEHLFDAALAEIAVVARGSLCLLAGYFNVEPISAGLTWMLLGLLPEVSSLL